MKHVDMKFDTLFEVNFDLSIAPAHKYPAF